MIEYTPRDPATLTPPSAGNYRFFCTEDGNFARMDSEGNVSTLPFSTDIPDEYDLPTNIVRRRVLSGFVDGCEIGTNNTFSNAVETLTALRFGVAGLAPFYAPRAWVNFSSIGTLAINASGNVASIADNGVGDFTINFTEALPHANYGVFGIASGYAGGITPASFTVTEHSSFGVLTDKTAAHCRIWVSDNNSDAVYDCASINVMFLA